MSKAWSWCACSRYDLWGASATRTKPATPALRCAACTQLVADAVDSLVHYRDKHWHVHCLLDHLVPFAPPPEPPAGFPGMWGIVP